AWPAPTGDLRAFLWERAMPVKASAVGLALFAGMASSHWPGGIADDAAFGYPPPPPAEPPGSRLPFISRSPNVAFDQTELVRQYPWRRPFRPGGSAGADSRGDRLLHHRRGRPAGRSLRVLLHRRGDRLYRRPSGHDLRRHRGHGLVNGDAGSRARPAISAGGDVALRRTADRRRLLAAGLADALRLALGGHRFR